MRGKLLGACPRGGLPDNLPHTFGVISLPQTQSTFLMDRNSEASMIPLAASSHRSPPSPTPVLEPYE